MTHSKHRTPPPKPIPRPGVEPAEDREETRIGGGDSSLPIDEMAAWLGRKDPTGRG